MLYTPYVKVDRSAQNIRFTTCNSQTRALRLSSLVLFLRAVKTPVGKDCGGLCEGNERGSWKHSLIDYLRLVHTRKEFLTEGICERLWPQEKVLSGNLRVVNCLISPFTMPMVLITMATVISPELIFMRSYPIKSVPGSCWSHTLWISWLHHGKMGKKCLIK